MQPLQRPSAASPSGAFSPEALNAVPEGPSDEKLKTGGADSPVAKPAGASSPMKGAHIAAIPPWTGCAISRVNGAADQMGPSGTSRSKPNAAWSVHAGDAFAFLAPGASAGDGMARRDGKRPKRNVSFTEGAPESVLIPSVLCLTPRRLQTRGDRVLPNGATDEATWLLYSGDGGLGFELDEQGVVLSVAGPAAPFSVTPPFRTSPQAERRGGGAQGQPSPLTFHPHPRPNPHPHPHLHPHPHPHPHPHLNPYQATSALGLDLLPAAPSVAKMPSLGGLGRDLSSLQGQAGDKLQAALKDAALPSMPSMTK